MANYQRPFSLCGFSSKLHPEIFKVQAGAFKIQSVETETKPQKLEVSLLQ